MADVILVGAAAVALYCFVGAVVGVLICYVVAPRVLGEGADDLDVVGAAVVSGVLWPVAVPAWIGAAGGLRLTRRLRERDRSRG